MYIHKNPKALDRQLSRVGLHVSNLFRSFSALSLDYVDVTGRGPDDLNKRCLYPQQTHLGPL